MRVQYAALGVFLPQQRDWKFSPYADRYGMLLSISVAVVVPKTSSFSWIFPTTESFILSPVLSGRGIIAATRHPCITDPDVPAPKEK
ncbi:hypothetical protein [Streptomyces sp. NPDC006415]|uniref:hypothetical protein n=1 Tax=Streptomyces sp. NPDC006415 TaxID=3155351 RepID=UPI0033ACF17D